jgi:hypothetical protein
MGQQERDELEKRAREERMEMVANAERMDREQEERAKGQIGEALVCSSYLSLLKKADIRCEGTKFERKKYERGQIVKRQQEPKHSPELFLLR